MQRRIYLLFIVLFLNFNNLYSKNDSLLGFKFNLLEFKTANIEDVSYVSNEKIIFSTISQPIDLFLYQNKEIKPLDIINNIQYTFNLRSDPKILLINYLFTLDNNNVFFNCGMMYGNLSGFYKLEISSKKLELLTKDIKKYKELIYNIKLDNFIEKNNNIILILNKRYIYYSVLDEKAFTNIYDIYEFDLKSNQKRLFYQGIDILKMISIDDEIIILSSDTGVLIIDSKGNLLQNICNLSYSTGSISPDGKKILLCGLIFEKDLSNYSTEDKFSGKAKVLTSGVFEFLIRQDVKDALIADSKTKKQLSESDRIKELNKPDSSKKIFIKYYLILTPVIDKLRLRDSQDQNGKVIRSLINGEKLHYLESGNSEIIDNKAGTWVKVKTEKGEIGWCFDAYLEEVK